MFSFLDNIVSIIFRFVRSSGKITTIDLIWGWSLIWLFYNLICEMRLSFLSIYNLGVGLPRCLFN